MQTTHFEYDIAAESIKKIVGDDHIDISQEKEIRKLLKLFYAKKIE